MIVLSRSKNAASAIGRRDYGARPGESPGPVRASLTRNASYVTVTLRPARPCASGPVGSARRVRTAPTDPPPELLPASLPAVVSTRLRAPRWESVHVVARLLVTQGWLRNLRHRRRVCDAQRASGRPRPARRSVRGPARDPGVGHGPR